MDHKFTALLADTCSKHQQCITDQLVYRSERAELEFMNCVSEADCELLIC